MSRPNYPTRLRDLLGNEVHLSTKPFATGGEGAVFEVLGQPNLVAKLYNKPQNQERCDKLRAMAKLCNPDLLKIAAWPISTLNNGNQAAVEGILMPRIADHKEIHHLYSVAQRRKDFPEADWGFLLHTARNCAIAFESIHSQGHVVGDVNQKNVMVSKKGIVALVDCDSFQVKEGNRIFRCGVGVPEYTPPELHGRKFSDLDRAPNHDRFGLAVMVFHLLIMGRHPFVGVPQVNFDIPIEKAIQEGLYAYSRIPNKLKPPPHVPPMAMLDAPIIELFERAFGSAQRPTATEWRGVLDSSMKGLQRCKNDPIHTYPAAASNCPWCQLIAVARLMFFIPGKQASGAMSRIERIQTLIRKFSGMSVVFASYTRPAPILPVDVILPAGLRTIRKPVLLPIPVQPLPLQKPALLPPPPPPVFLHRPVTIPLPAAPAIPIAPQLRPHPPTPVEPPHPKLQSQPSAPEIPQAPKLWPIPPAPEDLPGPKLKTIPPYPTFPDLPKPDPLHPFLPGLCIAGILGGVPMAFVAFPVGLSMVFGFGLWLILMMATQGFWQRLAQQSLEKEHEAECAQILELYEIQVQPIRKANERLLQAWRSANSTNEAAYIKICKDITDKNISLIIPWKAEKAKIESNHRQAVQKVEMENRQRILVWEAEKAKIESNHRQAVQKVEVENWQRILVWEAEKAKIESNHRQAVQKVEVENRQRLLVWEAEKAKIESNHRQAVQKVEMENWQKLLDWEADRAEIDANYRQAVQQVEGENIRIQLAWDGANAPWISEHKLWQTRASFAEAEIKRLEDVLVQERNVTISKFQRLKSDTDRALKSHEGAFQDFERELRRAEEDSKKIQLEEYLDKLLIRSANLSGFTISRLLALESFGIETAKDIILLEREKVPGIGPVLSSRLFEWRNKLELSFRPKQGLPESEKNRVAARYAPVLIPLEQAIQTAINDLEGISILHFNHEAEQVKAIKEAVQNLAIAQAYIREMRVV